MHRYNKGKKSRFTIYETVQVEAEVDFSLKDVVDALEDDDDDAKEELVALLRGEKYVLPVENTDINDMLNHLISNSFRFDADDDNIIRGLAEKYNFLKL